MVGEMKQFKFFFTLCFIVISAAGFSITEKNFDVSKLDKIDVSNLEKMTAGSLGLAASKVSGDQRLIDKISVFRKLLEIFETGDSDNDSNLKMVLRNNIINYPFYFGTPCDLYDLDINHVEYQVGTDEEGSDYTGKETWMLFYDKDNDAGKKAYNLFQVTFIAKMRII